MDLSVELNADQFARIVGTLTSPAAGDSGGEQRRQPRAGLQARATIIPLSDDSLPSAVEVMVRDLSPSGIGFLHARKLSLDEQFALVLPRQGDTPAIVQCAVAFWQPLGRDLFAIGARFVRVLRDADIPLPVRPIDPAEIQFTQARLSRRKAS